MANHGTYNKKQKTFAHVDGYLPAGAELFHVSGVITSAAAITPVVIVTNRQVGPDRTLYLHGFIGRVNGATVWATTATVKLQDTGSPVDLVTMAVAALTGNARVVPGSANVTLEDAFAKGTGATKGMGLQLVGDANGTGSDLYFTCWGIIK